MTATTWHYVMHQSLLSAPTGNTGESCGSCARKLQEQAQLSFTKHFIAGRYCQMLQWMLMSTAVFDKLHRCQHQLPRGQRAFCMWGKRLPALHSWDCITWRIRQLPGLCDRDGVAQRVSQLLLPVPRQYVSARRCRLCAMPRSQSVISRIHCFWPVHCQCVFGLPHPALWPGWFHWFQCSVHTQN